MKVLLVATALLLASGCSQRVVHTTTAPLPTLTLPACPNAADTKARWPENVPQNLPWPTSAVFKSTQTSNGITYVQLQTPYALREQLLPLLELLRAKGYTIGRGDAESSEADVPFAGTNIRGLYKLIAADTCVTQWLIALAPFTPGSGTPITPTFSPRPSATPLTFP